MAIIYDTDGAPRRRDDAGHAGGLDQTRTRRIRKAQRHSRLVRILRIAMPLGALAIAGYYAVTLIGASNIGKQIARSTLPHIVPSSLTMKNPRYRGFTKDGGAYVVTAASARPHPKLSQYVLLSRITGSLTQKAGTTLTLTALLGTFNTEQEAIVLRHKVNLKTDRGGWARLKTLRYESRTGLITSDKPVEFGNPQSKISGERLRIMQKSKEMTISGNVRAIITPPAGDKSPAAQQAATTPAVASDADPIAQKISETAAAAGDAAGSPALTRLFTGGKGPIEITSDRLELDDIKKTAIFIGKVLAKQGDVTLTTPELRIAYDGAPSGGLTGAGDQPAPATAQDATAQGAPATPRTADASLGAGAKITSIVAANPVAITQAPATHMTATSAAFDAATQRATLAGGVVITRAPDTRITGQTAGFDDKAGKAFIDGDVVMVKGTDRRATGRHAEFDEKSQTALLTGDVVLVQGKNELRGQRLHIDQKAARTELTAPPMAGAGPGRITARFIQDSAKPAPKAAARNSGPLMGSFRTTPGAPVDIAANALEILEARKLAIFRGDVEARQGDFKFRTAELSALYAGEAGIGRVAGASADAKAAVERASKSGARLQRLQARGKVVVASRNGQQATGDWADFDVAANTVTMGGAVVLTQGRNVVKGTRLVIDMTTGESVINADNSAAPRVAGEKPSGGWRAYEKPERPRAVFFPRNLKGGDKAKKKPPSAATSEWQSITAPAGGGN